MAYPGITPQHDNSNVCSHQQQQQPASAPQFWTPRAKIYNETVSAALQRLQKAAQEIISGPKASEAQPRHSTQSQTTQSSSAGGFSCGNVNFGTTNEGFMAGGIGNGSRTTSNSHSSTTNIDPIRRKESGEEEKKKGLSTAALIGIATFFGAVTAGGFYLLGTAWNDSSEKSKPMKDIKKIERLILQTNGLSDWSVEMDQQALSDVMTESCDFFGSRAKSANIELACRAGLVGGAVIGLVGAILASPPAMITGGVVAFGAVCVKLFTWGMNSGSEEATKSEATTLNERIQGIASQLRGRYIAAPANLMASAPGQYE